VNTLSVARRSAVYWSDGDQQTGVGARRSWEDAKGVDGFADERTWEEHEPLRHKGEVSARVGIWCGREDPFHDAAVSYGAAAGSFEHGGHDTGYWRRVLPEALRFIG
jgi:hypothetical protein